MSQTIATTNVLDRAKAIHEKIRDWRRTIHRYPELSFTETKTAALVQSVLGDLGLETQTGVAKTGVVATIQSREGAPTVGLRADMDALPILEANDTDFNSERDGIMHACGHDSHTAMLLGAATVLKEMADKGELAGNIRLLFQPSEEAWDDEGKSGGKRMVEEGVLDGLDAVFGLHVDSSHDVGQAGTRAGACMAAADTFELEIMGRGGHAAFPQFSLDPIVMSAHVINAIHNIISRRLDPTDMGVITIANINGGVGVPNVIDNKVSLSGSIRSMKPETRKFLWDEIAKAGAMVEALGGSYALEIQEGYPVTFNDAKATEISFSALHNILGDNVYEAPPVMGSEDFSYMTQHVPGCFMVLGVKNPSWDREYPVHTPTFRIDEDALPIGTAMLVESALQFLGKH